MTDEYDVTLPGGRKVRLRVASLEPKTPAQRCRCNAVPWVARDVPMVEPLYHRAPLMFPFIVVDSTDRRELDRIEALGIKVW